MANRLKDRSLLTLLNWSVEDILYVLELSKEVKKQSRSGKILQRFRGMTLALIFEKRSTRTRAAFETAFGEEGGHCVFLSPEDIHLGVKESVEDSARVLGRMFNAIEFRGFKQDVVQKLADYSGVPVINGLTDDFHPTQALADMLTIMERFDNPAGKIVTYVGDGRNNVAVSLMIVCSKLGVNFRIVAPQELHPSGAILSQCKGFAASAGSTVEIFSELQKGIPGSDFIYTDVWVSMGEEKQAAKRKKILAPFQVNKSLMELTGKSDTVFLHCLPAVKEEEVTSEVFESENSRVFDQAENRKHTIKAVMLACLGLE